MTALIETNLNKKLFLIFVTLFICHFSQASLAKNTLSVKSNPPQSELSHPEINQKNVLSLEDAVSRFLALDDEIIAEKDRLRSHQYILEQNKASFLPEIKYTLSQDLYAKNNSPLFGANTPLLNHTLLISQNLYNGSLDQLSSQSSLLQTKVDTLQFKQKQSERIYKLKEIFIDAAYNKKLSLLAEKIHKQRVENLEILQLNFDSGREHKGTLLLIEAYLEEAKFDLFQAEKNYNLAIKNLKELLKYSNDDLIEISDSFDIPDPQGELNESELIQNLALYRINQYEDEIAIVDKNKAQKIFNPSIDIYTKLYQEGPSTGQMSHEWSAGISLTVPLFNGGKNYYELKIQEQKYQSDYLLRKSKIADLKMTTRNLWGEWVEAAEKCKFNLAFVQAAELRSKITRQKYSNGLITFDDWDNIENKLVDRQKDYLKSLRGKWLAHAEWEKFKIFSEEKYE